MLVNDPAHDYGNEQNSQFESTIVGLNGNVIVAYVDSNQGVYALGGNTAYLGDYTPRFVGYAVSRDGGITFQDMDVPPLSRAGPPTSDDGDAGDPVLGVDLASEIVYMVGTSPRNEGYYGLPVWKSIDGGLTFSNPSIVLEDIDDSDKPWIAVDNFSGTGQGDVFVTCGGQLGVDPFTNGVWLSVSTDGSGEEWSDPVVLRQLNEPEVSHVHSSIVLPGPNHTAYAFWLERHGAFTNYPATTNWIRMCQILDRGDDLGDVHPVVPLTAPNPSNGNLELKRSNSSDDEDNFKVLTLPVPAVNPVKTNHIYVAYPDKGTSATDRADVFFTYSTNGGINWTNLGRINTDSTTNDQWMPALAVKPDGTQLLMSWYDRRHDTNNALIDVYARFAAISSGGEVEFGAEFRVTTDSFPPVFAGTLEENEQEGYYDPVYPPGGVNLHWWYDEWPSDPFIRSADAWRSHVGEYNGAWTDQASAYITWTDYRLSSAGGTANRIQSDIRLVRISWPEP